MAGIGRVVVWLALAIVAAVAIDLTSSLTAGIRALALGAIVCGAATLAIRHFWWRPRTINVVTATEQVESAHPEFGQLLRTARDPSLANASVSPILKNELFRRAGVHLAGLDLAGHLPRRPAQKWLTAAVVALAGLFVFLAVTREAPVAFARLVAPFSGITYTRVKNVTPDPTFNSNRLPRVKALVSGRYAKDVVVHLMLPEGGEISFPMNPLGGGRYEVTLPAAESSFAIRIEAGDSQPAAGTMECVEPAKFVVSSAEIALPDYTGQPATHQDSADIEAVEGTRATLHFKMSAPMATASLKLPDGNRIPLTVSGDELSTTLDLKLGGDVAELTGTDARGHAIEPTQFKHKGIVDALPVVEWIEPTKDIDATAVAELPLRLRLRDDFGIASYAVVLQANGESKEIMTRTVEAKDLRDLSEMTAAALETFPLTIRDNVRLYAWATDHKPRDNARAVSKLRGVDIKPFKRKWQMLTGAAGPPIPPEDLINVEKLIKAQRVILSDSFPVTQIQTPPSEAIKGFGEQETKLQQDASVVHAKVVADGMWPADDINLLAAAVTQMGESANAWFAIKAQPGFDRADAALSTLLELRENLLTLLMRANCPCLEPKPEEVPNNLTDLAAEAERLAKEERDVGTQLTTTPDASRQEAIRRQQNVANSDTGELYARMIDHPEATPLVLSHMADAEKQVREATRTTLSSEAIAAAPPQLAAAADKLDEVAKHLRALDESLLDDTLAEMAKEAKQAAEVAKPNESPADKPAEQAANTPGEKSGNKPGTGKGEGEGQGEGAATERKEALAKAARQAATHDDVLKFFAEHPSQPGQAERFEALRKEAATAGLEQKLKDAAEGKADGKQTADDLKALAAALEQERELRRQSRLESLAKNREKAAELKKEAETRRDAAKKAAKEMAANEGGFSFDIPKQALEDARQASQGKGSKPGKGKGEGGPPGNGAGSGEGYSPRDLARDIDKLKDTELSRIARELEKAAPQTSDVTPLADAERRLAAMIAEISGLARDDDSGNSVPAPYRRAVEDYYRALSDDFGDEAVVPR